MHIRGVPREQTILFPERLEDYVTADNPVRVIDALVQGFTDSEWAAMGFSKAIAENTGRPPYHPADLVALYLWGFLNRVISSRNLEKACKTNVEVMWLLRKLRPDFWTISMFRRENQRAIRKLFRQFNQWCRGEGLFGGELAGVDGSKFRAVNSKDRNFTRTKVKRRLDEIDRAFEKYLDEIEQNDREEKPETKVDREELEKKIERLRNRRSEIVEVVKKMDETGEDQVSLTDPESRSMKTGGSFNVCYNAQISVDAKHGLIMTTDVTNAPNDLQQLSNTAIEAKEFLQVESLELVADSGYSDSDELKKCEEAGIEPYVRRIKNSMNEKKGLFTKYDFTYDAETDQYHCPNGATLKFSHLEKRENRLVKCYITPACRDCGIREQCTTGKERRIRRSVDEDLIERADRRARARPEIMARRKELVEHPFGTMKRWINGGYFLLKGLDGVKAEFDLAAMSFNIKRIITILGVEEFTARLRAA
jgi:transposase